MKKLLLSMLLLALLGAGCIPSEQQVNDFLSSAEQTAVAQITFVPVTYTPNVATIVAATFAAMTANPVVPPGWNNTPIPTLTISPTVAPGSISGRLNYPSDFIPPLRVVAFEVGGYNYRFVDTQQNQNSYTISGLRPGNYHVVAYTLDGNLAGGYTQAVPCGLAVGCSDHSLIDVSVEAGKDTPFINPYDWYAPEGTYPPMP